MVKCCGCPRKYCKQLQVLGKVNSTYIQDNDFNTRHMQSDLINRQRLWNHTAIIQYKTKSGNWILDNQGLPLQYEFFIHCRRIDRIGKYMNKSKMSALLMITTTGITTICNWNNEVIYLQTSSSWLVGFFVIPFANYMYDNLIEYYV